MGGGCGSGWRRGCFRRGCDRPRDWAEWVDRPLTAEEGAEFGAGSGGAGPSARSGVRGVAGAGRIVPLAVSE